MMSVGKEEDDIKVYGFKPQKKILYNKLLPYSDEINEEALNRLKEIKENLSKAIIYRDIRVGAIHWLSKLSVYIKAYGLLFSKEDHILFVKLLYEVLVIPDQEFWVTAKFAQLLNLLLKKRELLSPDDLELPWKPLSDVYLKLFHSSYKNIGMIMLPQNSEYILKNAIRSCRPYFPLNATREIITAWRPQLCPYDVSMQKAVSFLELFLPTMLESSKAEYGWKLWLDELMGLWNSFINEPMWSSTLFCLLSRLAWQNIGQINWEPYLPLIFTRMLWQFHLPVNYKKVSVVSRRGLEVWAVSMFIVSNLGGGSRTQEHLERLFKILESYFHPSNTGSWTRSLNDFQMKLTHYFAQRLHNERYRKPSWINEVTEEKKLSEDDITAFVKCLQPIARLSVFSKTGSYEAGVVLHRLALVRPEIVIPPLLEQLYSAMDTITEPHRLIASLQCVIRVARPLVLGGKKSPEDSPRYPEGPSHVIPLLFQALPGIDPNDVNKCMVTFQFMATLSALVPIVNCSSAIEEVSDLTEVEQELCLQTAEFENFVLQFITKALGLIESLALEQSSNVEREKDSLNLEENMVETGLSSTFKAILMQCHPKIFDSALECLITYTKGRCFEVKIAGRFVAAMWRSAAKVNAEKTLNCMLPGICKLILTLTENPEVLEDDDVDDELLFNMLLLSELVQSKGKILLKYIGKIIEVIERTIHLKSRKGYKMASSILRNLLWYLNLAISLETKSSTYPWDSPFSEYLPIRHWGEAGNIDNLNLTWNEPGKEEEEVIQLLVRTFLTPELSTIRNFVKGDSSISRERLHQSFCVTQDILYAGGSLPMWDEEPIPLVDMTVKKEVYPMKIRSFPLKVTLDSEEFPKNVRKAVADVSLELVDHLLSCESDDTKSLNYASGIFLSISFFFGVKRDEYEARWKSFERVKQSLSDSIVRKKQHIRALLIERTVLQYEIRILESCNSTFTETHLKMLYSLFRMATSHYSEVRRKAQLILSQFFSHFSWSYKLVLPKLLDILKKNPEQNHKEIKGALYVILGSKEKSLAVRRDWDVLNDILPALISAQHSEKLSTIRLFNSIMKTFCRYFELFSIHHQVTSKAIEAALNLLHSENPVVEYPEVDKTLESKYAAALDSKGRSNFEAYKKLVQNLSSLLLPGTLHWRRMQIGLHFLGVLIRPDISFPKEGVRALLSFCIHDNIVLRKVTICYIPSIFKNQKRKHKKVKIDPYSMCRNERPQREFHPGDNREDNRWMQYDKSNVSLTEEDFDKKIFVHKTWNGWYCWPEELEVYAPAEEQVSTNRSYEECPEEEKVVYEFFINEANVDKLISFLSLEENKGQDKFDCRKFVFFKGLFRNFGETFLPLLEPHLQRMVNATNESSQRCAAEIIAGMVRGTKHWKYNSTQKVVDLACSLLKCVFSKVLNESLEDWGTCLSYISMDRDPNRFAPIVELLTEDAVVPSEPSFLISSRLYLSQLFLEQQEWRIADCYHRLLKSLEPHLSSPYKSIRDRIGLLLYRIFTRDEVFVNSKSTLSPHNSTFVEFILPQLSPLISECGSGGFVSPDVSTQLSPLHSERPPSSSGVSMIAVPMSVVGSSAPNAYHSLMRGEHESSGSMIGGSRPESPKESLETPPPPSHSGVSRSGMESNPLEELRRSFVRESKEPLPNVNTTAPDNNGSGGDTDERKVAIRLMNTVCKYLTWIANYINTSFPSTLYKLLPHLCQLESIDSDLELRGNCVTALAYLGRAVLKPEDISVPISTLRAICQGGWWRARMAALSFLQVLVFNNMFTIIECESAHLTVKQMVLDSLADSRAEVRQMASQVLSGLFHSRFIIPNQALLETFSKKLGSVKRVREKSSGRLRALTAEAITERHSGALGLTAYVGAFPYDVPNPMPDILVTLSEHINDPQPISTDIKQSLSNFRRTHHDNWDDHKKKFSMEQLSILTDVLVSPSYYA